MTSIEIGGIYRVVALGREVPAALVLVTSVDEATRSATLSLLSPDVEFGSSTDLVISGEETGRQYALLAQSDIYGYVWWSQLDRRIGGVGPQMVQAVSAIQAGEVVDRPVAGPPVIVRSDPRWGFKTRELERLRDLTADCTRVLVDDGESLAVANDCR